jgi:hypothetical protein
VGEVAAELLGELHHPDSLEPLVTALKFGTRPVQLAAKRALQAFGPAAVPALHSAQGEQQPWLRRQIEEILEKIRTAERERDSA